MIHARTMALVLVAALLSPCGLLTQSSGTDQDVAEGAKVFKNSCSVCHSLAPGQTKTGPSLNGIFQSPSVATERKVRRIITSGKGNMPAFKDRLSTQQMSALLEFLRNQR